MSAHALLHRALATILMVAVIASSGCITNVSGKKEGDKSIGYRYALPAPLIEFTPASDGSFTVTPKLVPDDQNRYTVSATSIMGNYTFKISVENGLLKQLIMDGDSTVVADKLITAQAEITKARIAAAAAAEATEKKKADDAAAAAATALDAAETAVANAKDDLEKKENALNKLKQLQADPNLSDTVTKAQIVTAEIAVSEAQTVYDIAVRKRDALLASAKARGNADMGGANRDGPKPAVKYGHAWGPVYYTVKQSIGKDGKPTVALVPAQWGETGKQQLQFRTHSFGSTDAAAGAKDLPFDDTERTAILKDNVLTLEILTKPGKTIESLEPPKNETNVVGEVRKRNTPAGLPDHKPSLKLEGNNKVTATLRRDLPAGDYGLTFFCAETAAGERLTMQIKFKVN